MPNQGRGPTSAPAPQGNPVWSFARNLSILVAVGGLAVWALGFRSEVSQALRQALPEAPPLSVGQETPMATAPDRIAGETDDFSREIVIRKGDDSHFFLEAVVNGVPIRFLVDTGASDVVLSPRDARRLHLNAGGLRYDLTYQTANGTVRAASITLRDIRVGQLELYEVEASVNEAPMSISLLGMSFLERLDGYAVEGDRLILRW